jgi:hypothetical protein
VNKFQLRAFLDLTLSKKITFSACGFFEVDLRLLFAVRLTFATTHILATRC